MPENVPSFRALASGFCQEVTVDIIFWSNFCCFLSKKAKISLTLLRFGDLYCILTEYSIMTISLQFYGFRKYTLSAHCAYHAFSEEAFL